MDLAAGGNFSTGPFTSAGLAVLLGSAQGRFGAPPVFFDASSSPNGLVTADFNGDGHLDLVAVSLSLSLLRGVGDGTFRPPVLLPAPSAANHGAAGAGDFDGDGFFDLAFIGYTVDSLHVIFGDGAGGFGPPVTLPCGPGASSVVVEDFNRDGIADIISTNAASNTISRVLGNASRMLAPPQNFPAFTGVSSAAPADFNRDGKLDLVASPAFSSSSSPAILIGDGAGGFGAPLFLASAVGSSLTGDFNGDAKPDVGIAGGFGVWTYSGDGTGGFAAPSFFSLAIFSPVTADWNRDGVTDLSGFLSPGFHDSSSLATYVSDGLSGLALPNSYSLAPFAGGPLAAADFTSDGRPDLAIADGSARLSLLTADAGGIFIWVSSHSLPDSARAMIVGDFDGDAKPDLAVANGTWVSVFLGTGTGLGPRNDFAAGPSPVSLAVTDLNRDGHSDVVAANGFANSISILLGRGDGSFLAPSEYAAGSQPGSVAAADFDEDGNPDVVVANISSSTISLLLGDGLGGFRAQSPLPAGLEPVSLATADFDGDGNADIVVANHGDRDLSILRGNGDASFQPRMSFAGPAHPRDLRIADFNLDAFPDVAVASGVGGVHVFVNNGAGGLAPSSEFLATKASVPWIAIEDFDLDGRADLALESQTSVALLFNTNCKVRSLAVQTDISACNSSGAPLSPAPILRVFDDGGNPLTCLGGLLTASIVPGTGPAGAVLVGTTSVPISGGVSSFTDLSVDRFGVGYRLRFSHPSGFVALSRPFSVGPVTIGAPAAVCSHSDFNLASAPDFGPRAVYTWSASNAVVTSGAGGRLITFRAGPAEYLDLFLSVRTQDGCDLHGFVRVAIDSSLPCLAPAGYFTVTPCRVLDTRDPIGPEGPALFGGQYRIFVLAGRCGIPATAKAVAANLTVVNATQGGHLTVFPEGTGLPASSTLNFNSGRPRANNAILTLGAAGDVMVYCVLSASEQADLILDVSGYFE